MTLRGYDRAITSQATRTSSSVASLFAGAIVIAAMALLGLLVAGTVLGLLAASSSSTGGLIFLLV